MDAREIAKKVQTEYRSVMTSDRRIAALKKKLAGNQASYQAAGEYASAAGKQLGGILMNNMQQSYPGGQIPEADARLLIPPALKGNYEYVAEAASQAQQVLNKSVGLGLNALIPEFDEERAVGLAQEIAERESFLEIADLFVNQVENFSQNTVDQSIRQNVQMHESVGLETMVIREYDGRGLHDGKDDCEWCLAREGEWTFQEALENGVFERHPGCGCRITYITQKSTQIQTDWTKNQWKETEPKQLEKRQKTGIDTELQNVYNNPPAKKSIGELRTVYAEDVEQGWISPLSDFNNYLKQYARIEDEIVGQKTSSGMEILGQSRHLMQRVLGTAADPKILQEEHRKVTRSGVSVNEIKDALLNGHYRPIRTDSNGRSQQFYNGTCMVTIDPDTHIIIQCNPL